jgi:hypothetical protein
MKKLSQIGMLALVVFMVTAFGCNKNQPVSPIVGHWGCEQYVSFRTDSLGVEVWDTLWFEAVAGGEYELFFNADGSGLLKLNNSPAFIKEFSCKYEYNSDNQLLTVESSAWLYALYGSLFMDENQATFKIESLTDSNLVASWTNYLAEPQPFFERFFIKRID